MFGLSHQSRLRLLQHRGMVDQNYFFDNHHDLFQAKTSDPKRVLYIHKVSVYLVPLLFNLGETAGKKIEINRA